ncbi:MAG: hydroxyacid dehydrogenase [bacterium]|nr:hydroxyacid dehydrogenase [bacterium]MCY3925950.1 hydroxyacid dehydrogenase [bacterium]
MSGSRRLHRVWIDRPAPGVEIPGDVELCDGPTGADAVIVGSGESWDAAACRRLPRLKIVARPGIGYENVDVAGCAANGVAVCNAPDAPTVSTAEHTLALILAVAKRLKAAERRLRGARDDLRGLRERGALELDGRTLGLVGCGRIGSRVGRYAEALGMRVATFDPHIGAAPVGEAVELEQLWQTADVVSLHAPATPETRHIVDARSLAAMRPGAVLVNCARGSLVDHDALVAALESGPLAGAGLDVTDPEPLPPDHPLLARDDVIVTPHVASTTTVGHIRLVTAALTEALRWLRGGIPEHLLDADAAHPAVDRRLRAGEAAP